MTFNKLTPNLEVKDIRQTVKFYQNVLGFSLVMAVPETQDGIEQSISNEKEYVYALVAKDKVEIMFQKTESFQADLELANTTSIGASASFYMEIESIENYYILIKNKVTEVTELKKAWYGMREFYIKDLNGYILGFAEETK